MLDCETGGILWRTFRSVRPRSKVSGSICASSRLKPCNEIVRTIRTRPDIQLRRHCLTFNFSSNGLPMDEEGVN